MPAAHFALVSYLNEKQYTLQRKLFEIILCEIKCPIANVEVAKYKEL